MPNEIILHLIVVKWQTPKYSNKKELDDSNEVKRNSKDYW